MLQIENLYKSYKDFKVLNGLNMTVNKGELFGFAGPNGAGKTTTIRIICGLLLADSGRIIVDGIDAFKNPDAVKEKIGYVPDFFGVYDNLRVSEYMEFYASIYGLNGQAARKRCLELLDFVNLSKSKNSYVDELSRGMKQKLCLARCLIHNPQLLVLDEPASGLDPGARIEMRKLLQFLASEGKTVLISSHILPELARLCTNIGIIQNGELVMNGAVDEIISRRVSSNPLVISVTNDVDRTIAFLKEQPLVENLSYKDNRIRIDFSGDVFEEGELLARLIHHQFPVCSFSREQGTLESLFLELTGNIEGEDTYAH